MSQVISTLLKTIAQNNMGKITKGKVKADQIKNNTRRLEIKLKKTKKC